MLLIVTPSATPPTLRREDSESIARFLRDNAGKPVRIELKRHFGGRSGEQNAWYWGGVLRTIAEETGHDENELHEIFKRWYLPKKHVQLGTGVAEVSCSTTDLTTAEFTQYIERIRLFALQELSINVPPPLYSEA
jgi:hypothetical protein